MVYPVREVKQQEEQPEVGDVGAAEGFTKPREGTKIAFQYGITDLR